MYLRILKKDLKRKKTMNLILLIFIILASTFISSSANNMFSVMTALDSFFNKAEVPDYWFSTTILEDAEKYKTLARTENYDYKCQELIQIDPAKIRVNDKKLSYSNTVCISPLKNSIKIFHEDDSELTKINDGEIYLTGDIFHSEKIKTGDKLSISLNGRTKTFTVAGSTRDALFGSPMMGMTRFLMSDKDYSYFDSETIAKFYSLYTYTDDTEFMDKFNELDLNTVFSVNKKGIKTMYIMDMITAAVMMIVSVCLIMISMVILRFTINFTMSEEFREIGVMKAIGIMNKEIRKLYMIKYFAISALGGIIGLVLSVPFERMMNRNLSQNILLPDSGNFLLNIICTLAVIAVVVLFCYFCTGKIKSFSPVDAIRNGGNGERYSRKGFLSLSKSKLSPVPFMAVNDILSGLRRFASMILIFTIGLLLIIIPVNTINTLQSDKLITWFSMAECHQVISREQIFNPGTSREMTEDSLLLVKEKLLENRITADVFQEIMFRMNISHNGKKMSSLAFQGIGDVTTGMYTYLEGTAPRYPGEVAISHVVSENICAGIGDTVEIKNGADTQIYMVTAIYQSLNNLGEGIRFYQDEQLDYSYASGSFGIQIKYSDNPDSRELVTRKNLLKEMYPNDNVYSAGEYINYMIGDIAAQLQGIKYFILVVVLGINILVTVLMVRSFITKEKGEIAILKALGFKNSSLIRWQSLRIGIVLLISVVIGTLLSTPLSEISIGPVFQIMGAQSIEFAVVPLEVYVIYPLAVLAVTVLAGILASLQIRKIAVSETSNIE